MGVLIQALKDKNWDIEARAATVVNLLSRTGLKDPEAELLIQALKGQDMENVMTHVKAFLGNAIIVDTGN